MHLALLCEPLYSASSDILTMQSPLKSALCVQFNVSLSVRTVLYCPHELLCAANVLSTSQPEPTTQLDVVHVVNVKAIKVHPNSAAIVLAFYLDDVDPFTLATRIFFHFICVCRALAKT